MLVYISDVPSFQDLYIIILYIHMVSPVANIIDAMVIYPP